MKVRLFGGMAVILAACGGQPPQGAQSAADLTFHQKPQVTIVSPAQGAFIAQTASGLVDVIGTTVGRSLTVNGAAVAVDAQGGFHAQVPATAGINLITAHVSGLLGGEAVRAFAYGNLAAPDAALPSGVMVRSNAAAFDDHSGDLDDYSAIAKALLAQVDLMALVEQLPPYTYNFPGGSVDVSLTDVQFATDATVLDLSPKAVGAHMTGSLSSVAVSLQLVLHYGGDFTTNAVVSVDTVGFDGDLDAQYSAASAAIVGSMAAPNIALGTLKVTTDINFPGVDDFLTFLANQFKDLIAQTVSQQIASNSANHLALTLNQIGLPSSFDLTPYGLPATLLATDAFDGAWFDDQGVTISAATNFAWPAGTSSSAPGSIVFGSGQASSFPDSTMSVSVSMDALNQATFAVWGQNGLTRVVYPAKSWGIFKLDDVVATPALPPVVTPTSDGKLQVQLGDVIVTSAVHALFFDGPMQAAISATAEVAPDIDPQNGALRFTLVGAPKISIDVQNLLGVVPDALLAPLSQVLQAIAPSIVEKMIKPIEVPLPHLPLGNLIIGSTASLGLSAPVAVAVDPAAQRVMLSGDLAQY